MIKWIKSIFRKNEPEKFDIFLKELVKERKDALNPRQRGTYNAGPRWYLIIYLQKRRNTKNKSSLILKL